MSTGHQQQVTHLTHRAMPRLRLGDPVHPRQQLTAADVMHPKPNTIKESALAAEAAELMEFKRITSVLVVNAQNQLCGFVNSNDLMRAKVI